MWIAVLNYASGSCVKYLLSSTEWDCINNAESIEDAYNGEQVVLDRLGFNRDEVSWMFIPTEPTFENAE